MRHRCHRKLWGDGVCPQRFVFVFHLLVSFCFTWGHPEGWPLICCHTELFYMTSHNLISSLWGLQRTFGRPCRWDEDISTSAKWNLWVIMVFAWSQWSEFDLPNSLMIKFKIKCRDKWRKLMNVREKSEVCLPSCFVQPLTGFSSKLFHLRYIGLM